MSSTTPHTLHAACLTRHWTCDQSTPSSLSHFNNNLLLPCLFRLRVFLCSCLTDASFSSIYPCFYFITLVILVNWLSSLLVLTTNRSPVTFAVLPSFFLEADSFFLVYFLEGVRHTLLFSLACGVFWSSRFPFPPIQSPFIYTIQTYIHTFIEHSYTPFPCYGSFFIFFFSLAFLPFKFPFHLFPFIAVDTGRRFSRILAYYCTSHYHLPILALHCMDS